MPLPEGFIAAAIPAVTQSVTGWLGAKRQYKFNKKLAQDQNSMNRANMEWANEQNKKMLAEQLAYDSPEAQMARYKAAGLNPHLIYGSGGGSAGNQGSPIQFGQAPNVNMGNVDASIPDIAGNFIRAMQAQSQIGLNEARQDQSQAQKALTEIQTEIARTNPMLNPDVANWVSTSMTETARLKSLESRAWLSEHTETGNMHIQDKVHNEVEAMSQRLGLNNADLKIRNKILQSKEFENAIKEIEAKWLKDATVTPEHIRQGLMMLLGKMVGR